MACLQTIFFVTEHISQTGKGLSLWLLGNFSVAVWQKETYCSIWSKKGFILSDNDIKFQE